MFFIHKRSRLIARPSNETLQFKIKSKRIPIRTLESRLVFDGSFIENIIEAEFNENTDNPIFLFQKENENSGFKSISKEDNKNSLIVENNKELNEISNSTLNKEIKEEFEIIKDENQDDNADLFFSNNTSQEAENLNKDKENEDERKNIEEKKAQEELLLNKEMKSIEVLYEAGIGREIKIGSGEEYRFKISDFKLESEDSSKEIIIMSLPESGELFWESKPVKLGQYFPAVKVGRLLFVAPQESNPLDYVFSRVPSSSFFKFRIRNTKEFHEEENKLKSVPVHTMSLEINRECLNSSVRVSRNLLLSGSCFHGVSDGWERKSPVNVWIDPERDKKFYKSSHNHAIDVYRGGLYNISPPHGSGVCGIEGDNFSSEPSSILQKIATIPGQEYRISLDVISDIENIRDKGSLWINGENIRQFSGSDVWSPVTEIFKATSDVTEVRIEAGGSEFGKFKASNDGRGLLVSNVNVEHLYRENDPPVRIFDKITFDLSNEKTIIHSAEIKVLNIQPGDRLVVDGEDADSGYIFVGRVRIGWVRTDNRVTLLTPAAARYYQEALYRITFKNTEDAVTSSVLRNIQITIHDGVEDSPPALITLGTIDVQDIPVAVDDSKTALRNKILHIDAELGLLSNDYDPDDDRLEVSEFRVSGIDQKFFAGEKAEIKDQGFLEINADGSYSFEPAPNYVGDVQKITYRVSDGVLSTQADLKLTVINPDAWSVRKVIRSLASFIGFNNEEKKKIVTMKQ